MKWFDKSKLHTVAELRTEYRRLLVKHHPDNGGKVSDMQEINSEYDTLYSILSKENNTGLALLTTKKRQMKHLRRF